ncbi:hypothetical protein D3C81_1570210 [compost metagenome]
MNHALDLFAAANDRIKIAIFGVSGQVTGQAIQRRSADIGRSTAVARSRFAAAQKLKYLLAGLVQADSEVIEYTGSYALAFTDQSEQNMLCSYISVAQLTGFIH